MTGYPVVTEVAVRWGDMDALAHVNHAVYLCYVEQRNAIVALEGRGPAPAPRRRAKGPA